MSDTPAIECSGLVRIYSSAGIEVQALQGLDLVVGEGELVAVVGASGSGKSTLLGILSALDRPTAGAASVAGIDLVGLRPRERDLFRRRTVGFVWQQTARNLLPYLTVEENVAVVAALGSRDRGDRARRAEEAIGALRLADVRDVKPAWLTGSQQQRAAIAVALVNDPAVLLADEPTGELDEEASIEVLEALRTVNEERGVTTVIVTHDAGVSEHVRRTVRIRDGRTSTETLRTAMRTEDGAVTHHSAREFAVLDRVGRLQLPEDFTAALGLKDRVGLALRDDHIRVEPERLDAPAPSSGDAERAPHERPRGRHAGPVEEDS
ncbi:ABC transporter ATP-binding protein [Cnuibacter sp. UC19_7]|uniref:ABC transporter ATP-binding protein n=1 Tax=Cnuibacter sp. UC19_7 TaxID=3350166 RepID=UPI00366BFE49